MVLGVNTTKAIQAIIIEIKKSRQRELESKRDSVLNRFGIKMDPFWTTCSDMQTIENLWDDQVLVVRLYLPLLDLIFHKPPLIEYPTKGFHVELGSRITYLSLSNLSPEKRISHYSRMLYPLGFIHSCVNLVKLIAIFWVGIMSMRALFQS